MLVFASADDANPDDAYPDDADPRRRWRPPVALAPLAAPDGTPQVLLGYGGDGGLLHLRLAAIWPAPLRVGERPVPIAWGRFRLLLRSPSALESGQWWPTPIDGAAIVNRSVSLAPADAAIARRLSARGEEVVEVEVELGIEGLAPVFPWLASVPTATLRERVAALLGSQPVGWDEVEAAFLGLAEDTFTWHPLAPAAIRPPRDDALRAIAHHVAPLMLSSAAEGWTLRADGPERLAIDLRVARRQSRRIALRWSLSAFLDAQPDRARHLVDITAAAPFEAAPLGIVNDLPLAAGGIREIVVEVRSGGPSGLLTHTFRPGEPGAVQLRFVRATFETLDLQWRARYIVSTAAGPLVGATEFRPGTPLIEINAAALGLNALRIAAEPDLLTPLASLEVTIGARTLVLTSAAPLAWAVGRQPPPSVSATAVLRSGDRVVLGDFTLGALGLVFGSAALGIGDPLAVILSAPADLPQRAAYLAVQVDGHGWRSVDPGATVPVVLRRPNRWQAPLLRYRTRHVPRAADGTTSAVVESAWRDASGEQVEIVC